MNTDQFQLLDSPCEYVSSNGDVVVGLTASSTGQHSLGGLCDVFPTIMSDLEYGLIVTGARPNVDYTRRDLINWTMALLPSIMGKLSIYSHGQE